MHSQKEKKSPFRKFHHFYAVVSESPKVHKNRFIKNLFYFLFAFFETKTRNLCHGLPIIKCCLKTSKFYKNWSVSFCFINKVILRKEKKMVKYQFLKLSNLINQAFRNFQGVIKILRRRWHHILAGWQCLFNRKMWFSI